VRIKKKNKKKAPRDFVCVTGKRNTPVKGKGKKGPRDGVGGGKWGFPNKISKKMESESCNFLKNPPNFGHPSKKKKKMPFFPPPKNRKPVWGGPTKKI